MLGMVLALASSGCATVNLPKLGTESVVIQDDERRLFNRAKEIQEVLDRSDFIYKDKAIEEYLNAFIPKLLPRGVNASEIHFEVKVLADPALNAFSFPNGRIYVHTGILAAAENDSQIATLLGHELTHVTHRHGVKGFRSLKNTTAWWDSVGLFTGGLGMIVSELAKVSSVSGFSQDLETEADESGFEMIKNAGFDVTQSVAFFERLQQYNKDEKQPEPYFFSSHPKLLQRVRNFKRLIGEQSSVAPAASTPYGHYQKLFHELIIKNLQLCLERGMFMTAENQLARLFSVYPNDARLALIKGDLYRVRRDPQLKAKKRDKTEDYKIALTAYNDALAKDDTLVEALLGKGRVLHALGHKPEALVCLNQYLQVKPDTKNKNLVEYLIKKVKE